MERIMELLNKDLCRQFQDKLLYSITPEECRVYAAASLGDDFMKLPEADIVAAIERAMREEIEL